MFQFHCEAALKLIELNLVPIDAQSPTDGTGFSTVESLLGAHDLPPDIIPQAGARDAEPSATLLSTEGPAGLI
jgi:hypothetical protein